MGKFFAALAVLAAAVFFNFNFAARAAWADEKIDGESEAASKVAARVGSEDITEAEVEAFINSMGAQQAQQMRLFYSNPQGRRIILDQIISMKLYALEGEKILKLDETPDFKNALNDVKNRMLAQAAMQELVKDVNITDEDVQKFYEAHPEHFTQPELVHARHILISDDAKAEQTLAQIQADLKAGKDFGEIAKEISICPSNSRGGDLGEFGRGQMVKEFEDAAFALKNPGDISQPVKTRFGWHIIKLESKTPETKIELDEQVKAQVKQQLEAEKVQAMLRTHAEDLKKQFKVEIIE